MNSNSYPYGQSAEADYAVLDTAVVQRSLQRTFLWMTLGLAITAFAGLLAADTGFVNTIAVTFWGFVILELVLVYFLSARIEKMSMPVATACFAVYAALNGLTLSPIFLVYELGSLTTTFLITAGTFAAMAVVGYTTKRDLTKLGSLLTMALIGIIIASVVNIFVGASWLGYVTSYAGVVIFVGLTAYDTQKIKHMLLASSQDEERTKRVALLGALSLYLDFINLFLFLLRIFGGRRD